MLRNMWIHMIKQNKETMEQQSWNNKLTDQLLSKSRFTKIGLEPR